MNLNQFPIIQLQSFLNGMVVAFAFIIIYQQLKKKAKDKEPSNE